MPLGGGRTPQHRLTKVLAWLYWLTKKCSVEKKKMYEAVDMIKSRPNRQILCSARDNVCRKTTKLTNKVSLFVKLLLRLNLCAIYIVQLPPVFYTKPPCYSPIIINEIKRQNTLRKSQSAELSIESLTSFYSRLLIYLHFFGKRTCVVIRSIFFCEK